MLVTTSASMRAIRDLLKPKTPEVQPAIPDLLQRPFTEDHPLQYSTERIHLQPSHAIGKDARLVYWRHKCYLPETRSVHEYALYTIAPGFYQDHHACLTQHYFSISAELFDYLDPVSTIYWHPTLDWADLFYGDPLLYQETGEPRDGLSDEVLQFMELREREIVLLQETKEVAAFGVLESMQGQAKSDQRMLENAMLSDAVFGKFASDPSL